MIVGTQSVSYKQVEWVWQFQCEQMHWATHNDIALQSFDGERSEWAHFIKKLCWRLFFFLLCKWVEERRWIGNGCRCTKSEKTSQISTGIMPIKFDGIILLTQATHKTWIWMKIAFLTHFSSKFIVCKFNPNLFLWNALTLMSHSIVACVYS